MRPRFILAIWLCFASLTQVVGQTREEKVRGDKKTVEAAGYWIYNDLPRAFAESAKTGKPIMVVLRCIPCVECVKLDDEIFDRDETLRPLLDRFTRVRVVSTNGLDLSLFQYDTDQSFAVFFLNPDRTIYGRFGTRSHRTEWIGDVSVEGLVEAMRGALELHDDFANVKKSLVGKTGPKPEFASPELFPSLKVKFKATLDYEGQVVQSCIHCHQIGDAVRDLAFVRKQVLPDAVLFPYPHPKTLGLILDPKRRATVESIVTGGDAEKAGLRAGDAIVRIAGQPPLSMADVQWVLHNADANGTTIPLEIVRAGKSMSLELKLPLGWRERDDISWRASTWGLRRKAFGGMLLVAASNEIREKQKLAADRTALLVQHVGQFPPHNVAQKAGVLKGDLLIGFDGRSDLLRETDLLAYTLRKKKPGDTIELTILRDGAERKLALTLPE